MVDRAKLDVEVGELVIPPHSRLVGQTIAAIEARRKHGLLIVAIKQAPGAVRRNVNAQDDLQSRPESTLHRRRHADRDDSVQSIAKFREEYQL